MARRRRDVSQGERALWRRVVADVAPLAKPAAKPPSNPAAKSAPNSAGDVDGKAGLVGSGAPPPATNAATNVAGKPRRQVAAPPAASPPPPPRPTPQELRTGSTPGIDRRTADRARKGKMQIDARLDLHGMTQAVAHERLRAFIAGAQAAGHRMVLVITGRGAFTGGQSVLKSQLPRWLNDPPLSGKILGFTAAQPRHGGQGAWYVLIKRKR